MLLIITIRLLMIKMALETFNVEKMQEINLIENKNNNDIFNLFSSKIDSLNIVKTCFH